MIEDLNNNRWKIINEEIYAPNLITALERFLMRRHISDESKKIIREKLKEMKCH